MDSTAAVDGYTSDCCDLDVSRADRPIYVTQFLRKYLRRYCIHPVYRVIACGDLDLWSQKIISTSTNTQYIREQNLANFPLLGCEIWCSQGFLLWSWRLTFWPNQYIPGPDRLHTSANFGEISSNIYEDSLFTRFYRSLPAMTLTLTFDFSTQKSNQHICECKYICDQNWVKLSSLVMGNTAWFACRHLDLWLLT